MRIAVIADEDTVLGFRFGGIEGRVVESPGEALAAFEEVTGLADMGIVILTEEVAGEIRAAVDAVRYEERLPLIVEVPGPDGPLPTRRTLVALIREAVGISI